MGRNMYMNSLQQKLQHESGASGEGFNFQVFDSTSMGQAADVV